MKKRKAVTTLAKRRKALMALIPILLRRRRRKAEPLPQTVAKGLAAGLAGTAAMTLSSMIEQRLRKRPPSTAPGDAAAKLLHLKEFPSEKAKQRFSNATHWTFGTTSGVSRALLGRSGMPAPAAAGAHLAWIWGSEQVMLPALHVTPPLTQWGAKEIAIDALHHVVYETATSATFEALEANRR